MVPRFANNEFHRVDFQLIRRRLCPKRQAQSNLKGVGSYAPGFLLVLLRVVRFRRALEIRGAENRMLSSDSDSMRPVLGKCVRSDSRMKRVRYRAGTEQ
jgi:hypothetical protein